MEGVPGRRSSEDSGQILKCGYPNQLHSSVIHFESRGRWTCSKEQFVFLPPGTKVWQRPMATPDKRCFNFALLRTIKTPRSQWGLSCHCYTHKRWTKKKKRGQTIHSLHTRGWFIIKWPTSVLISWRQDGPCGELPVLRRAFIGKKYLCSATKTLVLHQFQSTPFLPSIVSCEGGRLF